MERNDVTLCKLNPLRRRPCGWIAPRIVRPHAAGERLYWADGPRPLENLGQHLLHKLHLVGQVLVVPSAGIVRLVPHVPRKDAIVTGKPADDAGDIRLEPWNLRGISQSQTRTLHPSR